MRTVRLALATTAASFLLGACGKPKPPATPAQTPETEAPAAEESENSSDQEKAALRAARPFLEAIAAGDHAGAYGLLSAQAKARMSLNQFKTPPEDEAAAAAIEAQAVVHPTLQDFQKFMVLMESEHGKPATIKSVSVMSTDAAILSGKGDAMETAFSIGLMPDFIPADIRKASVRSQIGMKLSPEDLQAMAEAEGMTVEELQKSEAFSPYCNLKVVLIEEVGELKVGYFEFTPASMWD